MAKPSQSRIRLLTPEELDEPTSILTVRIPKSWRRYLLLDGSYSDKILPALEKHVRRLQKDLPKP